MTLVDVGNRITPEKIPQAPAPLAAIADQPDVIVRQDILLAPCRFRVGPAFQGNHLELARKNARVAQGQVW